MMIRYFKEVICPDDVYSIKKFFVSGILGGLGWIIGFTGSILGALTSHYLDYPTGASVVCVFGLILIVAALVKIVSRDVWKSA